MLITDDDDLLGAADGANGIGWEDLARFVEDNRVDCNTDWV